MSDSLAVFILHGGESKRLFKSAEQIREDNKYGLYHLINLEPAEHFIVSESKAALMQLPSCESAES